MNYEIICTLAINIDAKSQAEAEKAVEDWMKRLGHPTNAMSTVFGAIDTIKKESE